MLKRNALTVAALGGLGAAVLAARKALRRTRALELEGAKVLITGGSRGLGFATARAFVRRGADVAICARSLEELHRAKHELEAEAATYGGEHRPRVITVTCDVTDPRAVATMVDDVVVQFGHIDVLVNCAAEMVVGPLESLTATDFQAAMHRIFFSMFHPTQAVFARMSRQGRGRIVNVTSIGGRVAQPHLGTYTAAKFAATGFSDTLAIEARKHGVRVSTVTPPPLRNAAFLNVRVKGDAESELLWFARSLTNRLLTIDPERAAQAIVDAARFGDAARAVAPISWFAARLYALMPALAVDVMSAFERRALPAPALGPTYPRKARDIAKQTRDPGLLAALDAAIPAAERYLQPGRT